MRAPAEHVGSGQQRGGAGSQSPNVLEHRLGRHTDLRLGRTDGRLVGRRGRATQRTYLRAHSMPSVISQRTPDRAVVTSSCPVTAAVIRAWRRSARRSSWRLIPEVNLDILDSS